MQRIDTVIFAIEGVIVSIFVLVIFEILTQHYYGSVALPIILTISNGTVAWMMLILSRRLYVYYKSRHDRTILSYLISGIINAAAAMISIFFMVPILLTKPVIIMAATPVGFFSFSPGSILDALNYVYYIITVISFLSVWVSTALLLFSYSKRIGKLKYWLTIGLPLLFYISQILVAQVSLSLPLENTDMYSFILYYKVIFTISSTLGGILFSVPIVLISRTIPKTKMLHHQLIIFGLGLVLLFVSGSATVIHTPFPPFGLATVAVAAMASYLMFLGLYSSAISLSEDQAVRKQIRKSAEDSKFFLKLGDAEVEKRILDQVEEVKSSMVEDTGVAPSISVEEAKNYLTEVLNEMKKVKK